MNRCLLSVHGLVWLAGIAVVAWGGLFGAAAIINRWIRESEGRHGL